LLSLGEGVGVTKTVTVGSGVGTGALGTNAFLGSASGADKTTETTPIAFKFA
jgi:hypothetical protein